jgi:hypothetical protein
LNSLSEKLFLFSKLNFNFFREFVAANILIKVADEYFILFRFRLEMITFIIDDFSKAKYPDIKRKFNFFQTTICDIVERDNYLVIYIIDEFIDHHEK